MPSPGSCIYSDIICKFVHAHVRSRAGKGSCVQISFNFHLMGLVFLDLESRCKDRHMISIFGNVHCACYLLSNAWWITHIHPYCLGMWKYIHVDIRPMEKREWASVSESLPSNSRLNFLTLYKPAFSPWPQRLPACQWKVSWAGYYCAASWQYGSWEQTLKLSKQASFTLSICLETVP